MKLLGRVAEAVTVRNCYDDIDINQQWLSLTEEKVQNSQLLGQKLRERR